MAKLISQNVSRREVLAGAVAAAGTLLLPPGLEAAQKKAAKQAGLIDVHHHIRPPGASAAIMKFMAHWSPAGAVEDMDKNGVATGMAYPGPILSGTEAERSAKARMWNEFAAKLGQDYPGRFGLFASLPFPHVEASLAEIDHALDQLNADGFGLSSSYGDLWLGDPQLWPIYEKLNSRDAVVFMHPNDASCCTPDKMTYNRAMMEGSWIEWPMNTARTILSLMVSGTLRRFPRIRFIFSHGGGVMPLLINRISGLANWPEVGKEGLESLLPDGPQAEFRKLFFDCAQACSPTNMAALRSLVPDTQILFGSDYPIFPMDYAAKSFEGLEVPRQTKIAIANANARAILKRW